MRIKWGKRSFTFMIIPDANSKVVRFRLSALLLYILPVLGLSVICLTLSIHIIGLKNVNAKNEIAAELAAKTDNYEQTITDKEQTIEQLQNDIISLSEQTEEMKLKFDELKVLEEQLRSFSLVDPEEAVDKPVGIASFLSQEAYHMGVGGHMQEVSNEEINHLIYDTKLTLSGMDGEVSTLITNFSVAKDQMLEQLQLMRITPSIWPTVSYKVSSKFGYRKDPFSRRPSFHAGVDIAGNSGDPVYAAADGVVTSAEYDKAYGYNVVIKHPSGVSTRYAHLQKYVVKKGQKISQNEKIGLLGSTGKSTGPHLHYEIIKNGSTIDPMPYLRSAGKGDH